jgi:hypothetical protein
MQLPIDTQNVHFASAGPAESVLDYSTKTPKLDESGVPIFSVPLFASGTGVKDSIKVKVSGEPKGLGVFTPVKVSGLVAITWEVGPNHGVSFRAERIESMRTPS